MFGCSQQGKGGEGVDFIDIMQIMAFSALFGYVFAMMSGVSPEDVPRGRSSRDSGAQKE